MFTYLLTLTNTDYQIVAKGMARGMGLIVNKLIINEDQVGYLKAEAYQVFLET